MKINLFLTNKNYQFYFFVLPIFLIATIPLIFLGYGGDYDIYLELNAGYNTWNNLIPSMSRHPGYWLHEAFLFWTGRVGGYSLVNFFTLLASITLLYRFWCFENILNIKCKIPIILTVALNPWYLIASTSSIDYIWSLLFAFISIQFLTDKKYLLGGIFGGLSIASRLGLIFTLFFSSLFGLLSQPSFINLKKYVYFGSLVTLISGFFYSISWVISDHSFQFLRAHIGDPSMWSIKMHIGRAIYKPIYLFGLLSFLWIVFIFSLNIKTIDKTFINNNKNITFPIIGAILGTLILFIWYPLDITYLLPLLPFFYLIFSGLFNKCPEWQYWILVFLTISFNFFSIPIASPNTKDRATDATFNITITKGVLLEDIDKRLLLLKCNSSSCYEDIIK